jgi:hypothetical protein
MGVIASSAPKTACAGGLSQEQLDQLSAGENCRDSTAEPSNSCQKTKIDQGAQADLEEPIDSALHSAKKKRRKISFTGMRAEISSLSNEVATQANEEDLDLRGGLSQAALDKMMVADDDVREDSPICTSLLRRKRSRISQGGAGFQNMIAVASETLQEDVPPPEGNKSLADETVSPRKSRARLALSENMLGQPPSPIKKAFGASEKLLCSPPRRQETCTPLSPVNF